MSGELVQFENSARQIENLLAELGLGENPLESPVIGPEWMARAQSLLNGTDALLTKCGPAMPLIKTTPEVCHYRKQLAMMGQILQQLHAKLQSQGTDLRNEHLRVKRLQGWANSVSMLK